PPERQSRHWWNSSNTASIAGLRLPWTCRDTGQLAEDSSGGKLVSDLQPFESLPIAVGSSGGLELGAVLLIDLNESGIEAYRMGRRVFVIEHSEPGGLHGIKIASWGLQTGESPQAQKCSRCASDMGPRSTRS